MGLIVDSGQRSTDALISLRKKGEADRDSDIEKKEEVVSKPETLQEEEPEDYPMQVLRSRYHPPISRRRAP